MTAFELFLALSNPWGISTQSYPQYYVPGVAISYQATIDYWADVYLVPRDLARATPRHESSYRHLAVSRGKSGVRIAGGLFQINFSHARAHAASAGVRNFNWRNPNHSARVGIAYMSRLMIMYHRDRMLTVAAYNCGPGRLASAKPLPAETIRHLKKFFG